jgi:membrane protease YdiL (CAAX protease family)
MAKNLTRREALLAAFFPLAAFALLNHFYLAPLHRLGPAAFWAVDVVQFILVPCACWVFLVRHQSISAAELGLVLKSRHWRDQDFWGAVAAAPIAIATVSWLMFKILNFSLWEYGEIYPQHAMPHPGGARVLVAAYMALTAGLVEEVVWRAVPWLYFREAVTQPWRRTLYVLVTSAMFAVAHSEQGPSGVIGALVFGLAMAWIYSGTRTLWPLVLGHALVDFMLFAP